MKTRSQTNNVAQPLMVDVTFVGDRSGSMVSMGDGLIEGATKFVKSHSELAKNGESTTNYNIKVVSFDNVPTQIYDGNATDFFENPENTDRLHKGLEPRGTTRLYDTIINEAMAQNKRVTQFRNSLHPSVLALNPRIVVILAVLTDGEDNVSSCRSSEVRAIITHHIKEFDATCQFIAANQNANMSGARMGFPVETCLQMDADPEHAAAAMESVTYSCIRTISGESPHFSDIERTSSARYMPGSWQPTFPIVDEDDEESQPCRM